VSGLRPAYPWTHPSLLLLLLLLLLAVQAGFVVLHGCDHSLPC
jgi:hypothetical protein